MRLSCSLPLFLLACAAPALPVSAPMHAECETYAQPAHATRSDGAWWVLDADQHGLDAHHVHHLSLFGRDVKGINRHVLRAIDGMQASQPTGGGYFIGVHAEPPESPVGHAMQLYGQPMLSPTRSSSYCTGATYGALMGAIERTLPDGLDAVRLESLRLQELDGARRDDERRVWGWWNADGAGSELALVQLVGAGTVVDERDARPGDFINISWRGGRGHSAVFLGWTQLKGEPAMRYWSSNKGTNGYGDQTSLLSDMVEVVYVRYTRPNAFRAFHPEGSVERRPVGQRPSYNGHRPLRVCELG